MACGDEHGPVPLALRVHQFRGQCALPSQPPRGSLSLQALGDFEPGNDAAEILPIDDAGAPLRFPAATQAVLATIADGSASLLGYAERRASDGLDLLLWPDRPCVIASGGYPGKLGGQALGFAAESSTLLVAGGNDSLATRAIVGGLTLDTNNGELRELDGASWLQEPRAFASVTAFGAGFLVAGGQKPVAEVPESELDVSARAEIFDPARGRFEGFVQLQNARSHHAAVVLADGRTLLVGGRSKVGRINIAQYQLEVVDPANARASIGEVIAPRIDPVALRLADGRIFIGGGTKLDGSLSAPVGEWLTREAGRDPTALSPDVPPRFDRAFTALPGGGVLAVGGCEDRVPTSDRDEESCEPCREGCRPLEGYDAWWIEPSGAASSVTLPGISAARPRLFSGSDGSPWLVAASSSEPETPRLFRFNPWLSSFEPARLSEVEPLPPAGSPALSLAPDTLVWIDDARPDAELLGLRLGARSRYTRDLALVRSSEPDDPSRPQHLVPTRPLQDGDVGYDGQLTLRRPDVAIAVADTDYADVTIKLGVKGQHLPHVHLGATTLGGDSCPWPDGESAGGDFDLPTIVRRGARAQLRYHGSQSNACEVEPGRLTVALSAGRGTSVVTQLEIQRDGGR